jgi:hypothetical protein
MERDSGWRGDLWRPDSGRGSREDRQSLVTVCVWQRPAGADGACGGPASDRAGYIFEPGSDRQ